MYDYDFGSTECDAVKIFWEFGHFSWFVEGVKIDGLEVKKILILFLYHRVQ